MSQTNNLLDALDDLVWYCAHHEGWQDDHDDIRERAKAVLREWGREPRDGFTQIPEKMSDYVYGTDPPKAKT